MRGVRSAFWLLLGPARTTLCCLLAARKPAAQFVCLSRAWPAHGCARTFLITICVLVQLAAALNVRLVPQHYAGKRVLDLRGKLGTYTTDIPSCIGLLGLLDLQQAVWRMDHMRRSVPAHAPHTALNARAWDAMSAETAVNSLCFTDTVRRLFYVTVRAVLGVEPRDVSFLNLLCYCASATASGSFEELVQIRNGNQEATFHGGSQQLCARAVSRSRTLLHCLRARAQVVALGGAAATSRRAGAHVLSRGAH